MIRAAVALAALPVLVSCRLDLTEPAGPSQARLLVSLALVDSTPAAWGRIHASLWPGEDADGRVRAVADPSLHVAGTALPFPVMTEQGELRYAAEWSFARDGFGGLVVDLVAPKVVAVPQTVPPVALAPWRAGPSTMSLRRGADLVLVITVPGDTLAAWAGLWALTVREAGAEFQGLLFQASGRGLSRMPLVVPGGWLAEVEPDEIEVDLFLQDIARAIEPDGGLEIMVLVSVGLSWQVTLVDP